MKTMGKVKRMPTKLSFAKEICEYCDFARTRVIDGTEKIVCVRRSPRTYKEIMQGFWPVVEPENSCGEFKFNHG